MNRANSRAVHAFTGVFVAASAMSGWYFVEVTQRLKDGQTQFQVFFFALVMFSLCVALALFGVLHSEARVRARSANGWVTLGGPAAMFMVVIAAGYVFGVPRDERWLVVRVFDVSNKTPVRGGGQVAVDVGGSRVLAQLDLQGEARITGLSAKAWSDSLRVTVEVVGYPLWSGRVRAVDGVVEIELPRGTRRAVIGQVLGHMRNRRMLRIDIDAGGIVATTDSQGHFSITVDGPPEKAHLVAVYDGDRRLYSGYHQIGEELSIALLGE